MKIKEKTYEQIEFPEGGLPLYVYYTLLSTENEVLRDEDICSGFSAQEVKDKKRLLFTALNGYPHQIYSDSKTCEYSVNCGVNDSKALVTFKALKVNPDSYDEPFIECRLLDLTDNYSDIETEVWFSWNWEDLDWYGLIDEE